MRNVTCHIQSNWSYACQNTSWLNGLERSPREHHNLDFRTRPSHDLDISSGDPSSSPRWTIKKKKFKNLLSYRMHKKPTLTTVLRRVGEFNTNLIARLKLPKKSIITRSRHEQNQKDNPSRILNSAPSGRVKTTLDPFPVLLYQQPSRHTTSYPTWIC